MINKKKSGNKGKSNPDSKINLVTAIINLITALILAIIAIRG